MSAVGRAHEPSRRLTTQSVSDALSDKTPKPDRNGIAELTHLFAPRSRQSPGVGEGHHPRDLSHSHVTDRTFVGPKHRLTSRHPMDSGLDRLRRSIEVIGSVAWVLPGSWPSLMIQPA